MKRTNWLCVLLALAMAAALAGCASGQSGSDPKSGGDHFSVTVKGTAVTLGEKAQPVLDALGDPLSVSEEAVCAPTDNSRTYDYGSFSLMVYQADDGYRIFGIWLNDNTVSTAEGIHIGSTTQEVKDAYGTVEEFSCGDISYGSCTVTKGSEQMSISLEDGVVASIQYST